MTGRPLFVALRLAWWFWLLVGLGLAALGWFVLFPALARRMT